MGVVLKAYDPSIEREVAIKVLSGHLAADATAVARFLAEAKAAGHINHPNVTAIYDVAQEGEISFLVMELVPGGSLADRLEKQGSLSILEATRALADACKGIGAAHSAGLIHRDVKPANLLLSGDGTIKVTDFGLAKITSAQSQQMTQAGTVIGTPYFMSPEQCLGGRQVDARSDVYSLGAAYYSLLTGKYPYFDLTSLPQVMYAHCHGEIPDPRTEDDSIPVACSRIIAKAMAKSPDDRYQAVKELLADLDMVSATLPGQTLTALPSDSGIQSALGQHQAVHGGAAATSRHPPHTKIAVGAGLLVLFIAAVMWWRPWGRSAIEPSESVAAEPIKIGILHSLSGTMAESESVVVDATLYAIDEINEAGGVMGRSLKAVVADGRSAPATFASEAERLITEEKVYAIFGCWTSASRKTVKPIVEEHDHLLVYPLQYEGLETSPNIVYVGATPNQQILPAIDWAFTTLGKRRFYLVGSDYVFPRAAHAIINDKLRQLGAEVVGESYLPLGESDIAVVVQAISQAQPDMILNTINGDSNTAFFRGLRHAGITSDDCPTLSFSITESGLRNLDPTDIAGDYTAWTYFQAIDTPENRQFVSAFREKYPHRVITDPMESAYVAVKLWARAANEAKSLSPRRVRRAMLEQRFASPAGEVRLDADTQHCYKTPRIGQNKSDGSIEIVWSAPSAVRPTPFPSSRTATEWIALLHDLYSGWGNHWSPP
ncbi:MAG: transporter substrate-binding protein [Pirellulales bacterium]